MRILPYILAALLTGCISRTALVETDQPMLNSRETVREILLHDTVSEHRMSGEMTRISRRLDIHYDGVASKALIDYHIDDHKRAIFRTDSTAMAIESHPLSADYQYTSVTGAAGDTIAQFYFRGHKLIYPFQYLTRSWEEVESRYFRFRISRVANYHPFAARLLDAYVDSLGVLLKLDASQMARLAKEKILYILCDSPEEVEKVAGRKLRGIYLMGADAIVSTFNCHRHEVAHLIMNYKLHRLPLYTHPFFQEGWASAVGGRGGKARDVINHLGAFLQQSNFATYSEILKRSAFLNTDPSIAYPLSGFYSWFLAENVGIDDYLRLYRKYSYRQPTANNEWILSADLPDTMLLTSFLNKTMRTPLIAFEGAGAGEKLLVDAHWGSIREDSLYYHFGIRGPIRFLPEVRDKQLRFTSQEFREIFPDLRYAGDIYLLEITRDEIKLFNFYTATLDAFYSNGLTLTPRKLQDADGNYYFAIRKSCFARPPTEYRILQ